MESKANQKWYTRDGIVAGTDVTKIILMNEKGEEITVGDLFKHEMKIYQDKISAIEDLFIVTDECFWIEEQPEGYNPDPKRKPHFTTLVNLSTGTVTKLGSGSRIKIMENTYREEEGKVQ